jgi:hypothetical protein
VRKSLVYEIGAAFFALFGAGLLVMVFIPVLNPGFAAVRGLSASFKEYLLHATVPLAILVISWALNFKTQRMKRPEK